MTTTNGLIATPYGSVDHAKFTSRHMPPRTAAGAIAAVGPGRLGELAEADDDDRLPLQSENAVVASTGIRRQQGRYGSDVASHDLANVVAAPTAPEISFGPFCLRPTQRLLFEAGRPVHIGGRGMDLLIALVDRAGEPVRKDELIARVWPNVSVCEGNLKTQIAALRATLGDGRDGARYVMSIPGRGYCFVAPTISSTLPSSVPQLPTPPAASLEEPVNPPARPTRLIGRAGIVHALLRGLQRHRFVTTVGPGGIGKTAVALAVAEAMEASCGVSFCFVDLSRDSAAPSGVTGALSSALGLATSADDPTDRVIALLRGRPTLIVLDCCDRVVDGAAVMAERLLESCPDVRILATSREALRAEGEAIFRLPALETPPETDGLTAIEALTFPSIQLFVERVAWSIDDFDLNDEIAPVVADICRRLDGLPLAIELAAAHVHAFGARGVAATLGYGFPLLMRGRRTALQRHQTLGAALDWSYETLSEPEQVVLRRLSVFAGAFTLDAACAIATDEVASAPETAAIVGNLVAKSLVQAEVKTLSCCYRMLETTRTYIQEKLSQSGEMHSVARRHAEYVRNHSAPLVAGVCH